MKSVLLLLIYLSTEMFAQNDSSFIEFVNGEKLFGKVKYKVINNGPSYLTLNDSAQFLIGRVTSFQNEDGYFTKHEGYKNNFLKRIVAGRINLYQETVSIPGNPYSTTSSDISFEYFSKDNGDIMRADYEKLERALSDNLESLNRLKTYKTLEYVHWGMLGGGAALIIAGLLTGSKDKPNLTLIVTGSVVGALSIIPYFMRKPQLKSAINYYNGN